MGCFVPFVVASKGPILYYLDEMSKKPNAGELLKQFKRVLAEGAGSDYSDFIMTCEHYLFTPLNVGSTELQQINVYLRDRWFDQHSEAIYFPELQPIAPILATGIAKAIELALGNDAGITPIDSWWIVDQPDVKVTNLVSPRQITLLFTTPRPPGRFPFGIWGKTAEAYTTARTGVVTRRFNNLAPLR